MAFTGPIAFVAYNSVLDSFAFVALGNIPAGEQIHFKSNFLAAGQEQVLTWVSGGTPAGTVVQITDIAHAAFSGASTGSIINSTGIDLNSSSVGDRLTAYVTPNPSNPNLRYNIADIGNISSIFANGWHVANGIWDVSFNPSQQFGPNTMIYVGPKSGYDSTPSQIVDGAPIFNSTDGLITYIEELTKVSNWVSQVTTDGGAPGVDAPDYDPSGTVITAYTDPGNHAEVRVDVPFVFLPKAAISVSDAVVAEGDNGTRSLVFTITRTNDNGAFNVTYDTLVGTATPGVDYTPTSGVLSFGMRDGILTQTVSVEILGDTIPEPDEFLRLQISAPFQDAAIVTDNTGIGTILNDDGMMLVSSSPADNVGGVNVNNPIVLVFSETPVAGTGTLEVRRVSDNSVVASADVTDGAHVVFTGNGFFFAPASPLPYGEDLYVYITPGAITDSTGHSFILTDPAALNFTTDALPLLVSSNPADNAVDVSPTGSITLTFSEAMHVGGSGNISILDSAGTVVATASLQDATQVTVTGNTLTFNPSGYLPGNTDLHVEISMFGLSDATGNAFSISDPTTLNFTTGALKTLEISDVSASEADGGLAFRLTRTGDLSQDLYVPFYWTEGSADIDDISSFEAPGQLTYAHILAGSATGTAFIGVYDDADIEPDETISVHIYPGALDPSYAVTRATATGTILNDDGPMSVSIAALDAVKLEGNSGDITAYTFTLTRNGPALGSLDVGVQALGSGASPAVAADFFQDNNFIHFNPGQTTATATIYVNGDGLGEADEGFTVSIDAASLPVDVSVDPLAGSAEATILNDDVIAPPDTVSIRAVDADKSEGSDGSTTWFTFEASRTGDTTNGLDIYVAWAGSGTDAAKNVDFSYTYDPAFGMSVWFNPGESTTTIVVPVRSDTLVENDETFTLSIVSVDDPAITIYQGAAQGIIRDDEPHITLDFSVNGILADFDGDPLTPDAPAASVQVELDDFGFGSSGNGGTVLTNYVNQPANNFFEVSAFTTLPKNVTHVIGTDNGDSFWNQSTNTGRTVFFEGGNGDDFYRALTYFGGDRFDGGAGYDTYQLGSGYIELAGISVNFANTDAEGYASVTLTSATGGTRITRVKNIEAVGGWFEGGDDVVDASTLTADFTANLMAGDDTFLGGTGNDTVSAAAGIKTFDGGVGIDLANFSGLDGSITLDLATGAAELTYQLVPGGAWATTASTIVHFENVTAGSGDDQITGTDGDNELDGQGGKDVLDGGLGSDTLRGGAGDDRLIGGAGGDLLLGNYGLAPGTDLDTAVYTGNFADYTLGYDPYFTPRLIVLETASGDEDSLYGIEKIEFADGTYDVASETFSSGPVALADTGTAGENETKQFDVLANDSEPAGAVLTLSALGAISVSSANAAINGIDASAAFSIVGGQVQFAPGTLFDLLHAGEAAQVEVPYTVLNPSGSTATATLTLSVTGAVERPVIKAINSDTGRSANDLLTSDTTLTISGTGEAGATVQLYEGAAPRGALVAIAADGTWQSDVTLGAGSHALVARTVLNGGTVLNSSTRNVRVDQTGPSVAITSQVLSSDTGASASDRVTSDRGITLTGTVSDANGVWAVQIWDSITGQRAGTATLDAANGTWSYSPAGYSIGYHALYALAIDNAGNTAQSAIQDLVFIDRTRPDITAAQQLLADTGASGSDNLTRDGRVTFTGTVSDNGTGAVSVEVWDRTTNTSLGLASVAANGSWSLDADLSAGVHRVFAVATDLAGNVNGSNVLAQITVDKSAPVAPSGLALLHNLDGSFTLTGQTEGGAIVSLFDNGAAAAFQSANADASGAWAASFLLDETQVNVISLTAMDAAGNTRGNGARALFGGDGIDSLTGTGLNDILYGGASKDSLSGGSGDDRIIGGAGGDILTGGLGGDVFVYQQASEGGDTIRDFLAGVDKVEVSLAGFGLTGPSVEFGSTATSTAATLVYDAGLGSLLFDADGTGGGAARLLAKFVNAPTLTATDFTFV